MKNEKRAVHLLTVPDSVLEKIRGISTEPIRSVMENPLFGKASLYGDFLIQCTSFTRYSFFTNGGRVIVWAQRVLWLYPVSALFESRVLSLCFFGDLVLRGSFSLSAWN